MRPFDLTAHALLREAGGTLQLAAAHGVFDLADVEYAIGGDAAGRQQADDLAAVTELALAAMGPSGDAVLTELRQAGIVMGPRPEALLALARIKILGSGRLARHIVDALVWAGVGELVFWDNEPPDLSVYDNYTRSTGAQSLKCWITNRHGEDWSRRATVVNHWTKPENHPTDLTIVATDYIETDRAITSGLVRADQAHVFARPFRRGVVLGPLVIPGHTPCTRCHDLTRTAQAPLWPAALSRLTQVRQTTDPLWARWAASHIVVSVAGFLAGQPVDLVGATVEICAEVPATGVRLWRVHPECGCDLIDTV